MRRIHAHLDDGQWEKLEARAEETGAPVSELIRRAVDLYLRGDGASQVGKPKREPIPVPPVTPKPMSVTAHDEPPKPTMAHTITPDDDDDMPKPRSGDKPEHPVDYDQTLRLWAGRDPEKQKRAEFAIAQYKVVYRNRQRAV